MNTQERLAKIDGWEKVCRINDPYSDYSNDFIQACAMG